MTMLLQILLPYINLIIIILLVLSLLFLWFYYNWRAGAQIKRFIPTIIFSRQNMILQSSKFERVSKVTFNLDGIIVYANEWVEHDFGYTDEEVMSKHISMLLPSKESIKTLMEYCESVANPKDANPFQMNMQRKNKEVFPVELSGGGWVDEFDPKQYYYVINIHDIDHRRKGELARLILQTELNRISSLCVTGEKLLKSGSWSWYLVDLDGIPKDTVLYTPNFGKIFRLTPGQIITSKELMDLVYEEDVESVNQAMFNSLRDNSDYIAEYRIERKNSTIKDLVRCIGKRVLNATGTAIRIDGTIQVIKEDVL